MRNLVIFVVFLSKLVVASPVMQPMSLVDTISPPPDYPGTIMGSQQVCVGETVSYSADIPIGCETNWFIDGIQQTTTTDTLEVYWFESGSYIISLEITCDTSGYPPSYLEIDVTGVPDTPAAIVGDDNVCVMSTGIYSTQVGEGENCQWKVDGMIQSSDSTYLSYYWDTPGWHTIEVNAINDCGLSTPSSLQVYVYDWPQVDLGNDTTIFEGQALVLDAGNPGCSYVWSTGDITQTITVTSAGIFQVLVSNVCGVAEDSIRIEVVVGLTGMAPDTELVIQISGNDIYLSVSDNEIKWIQMWDITGRLMIDSHTIGQYFLPNNGIFFVKVRTIDDHWLTKLFIK